MCLKKNSPESLIFFNLSKIVAREKKHRNINPLSVPRWIPTADHSEPPRVLSLSSESSAEDLPGDEGSGSHWVWWSRVFFWKPDCGKPRRLTFNTFSLDTVYFMYTDFFNPCFGKIAWHQAILKISLPNGPLWTGGFSQFFVGFSLWSLFRQVIFWHETTPLRNPTKLWATWNSKLFPESAPCSICSSGGISWQLAKSLLELPRPTTWGALETSVTF